MSTMYQPMAGDMPPGLGPGLPPGGGGGPSMADLALLMGAGGPQPPADVPTPGDADMAAGVAGMSSTDHIRSAIKHLMMAMTQSQDEQETHGLTKGMTTLQGLLAGRAKNDATIAGAGGTPSGA